MADSRGVEVPVPEADVQSRGKDGSPTGKALVGGAKFGGKALAKATMFAARGVAGTFKTGKRVLEKVGVPAALIIGATGAGTAAGDPHASYDRFKEFRDDPQGVTRSVGKEALDEVVKAVDTAIDNHSKVTKPAFDIAHGGIIKAADFTSGQAPEGTDASAVGGVEVKPLDEIKDKVLADTVDFYYPGAKAEDREKIATNIQVMHEYYKGTSEQTPLLPPETYEILASKWNLIKDVCANKPELANAIVGLAIAESRGGVDADVATDADATGPFMATKEFMLDRGYHDYELTNDENDPRRSWEIMLPIVYDELNNRLEHFGGNLGFAVWSWHRGVTAVDEDISEYAQINGLPADLPIGQLVSQYKLTEYDLEEEELIKKDLLHPNQNSTVIFVLRNAAGALVWIHVQQLADKIKSEEGQQPSATVHELPHEPQTGEKAA